MTVTKAGSEKDWSASNHWHKGAASAEDGLLGAGSKSRGFLLCHCPLPPLVGATAHIQYWFQTQSPSWCQAQRDSSIWELPEWQSPEPSWQRLSEQICWQYLSLLQDFLSEDTPIGTSFLRVTAHDSDQGVNAAITYSMLAHQVQYFQINPSTGWVYVNHRISQVMTACLNGATPRPITEGLDLHKMLCKYPYLLHFIDNTHQSLYCSNGWGQQEQHGGADRNHHQCTQPATPLGAEQILGNSPWKHHPWHQDSGMLWMQLLTSLFFSFCLPLLCSLCICVRNIET